MSCPAGVQDRLLLPFPVSQGPLLDQWNGQDRSPRKNMPRYQRPGCRLVESQKPSIDIATESSLCQEHKLIRSSTDYGDFFNRFASGNHTVITKQELPQVWRNADWLKVLAVFGLEPEKHRNDEVWIKSPFNDEENASLHLSLSQNVYKDFSSDKGGGILNFCQDLLALRGQSMDCYQVAKWMVEKGISDLSKPTVAEPQKPVRQNQSNGPVEVDLKPFLQSGHPGFEERGISKKACQYLGCGYLPERKTGKTSPLNGRLVFQVRGIRPDLTPVIVSHVGRALTDRQSASNGKYWGFPFSKKLEVYNQDKLLLDPLAREQVKRYGLTLVEGFFDVAALVSAGCLNAGAIMGAHISMEQIYRLNFFTSHMEISCINLFLDRDEPGQKGAQRAALLLERYGFAVKIFDWNYNFGRPGGPSIRISPDIKDPADMSTVQLNYLRKQGMI